MRPVLRWAKKEVQRSYSESFMTIHTLSPAPMTELPSKKRRVHHENPFEQYENFAVNIAVFPGDSHLP
jgi:hypothetical protein